MPRGGRSSRSPAPRSSGGAGGSGGSSGGGGGSAAARSMLTRKPPTHPDENNQLHKQNLVRNLDRNDAEIAALVQCNRTLRALREEIGSRYGEGTLLDVGEGTIGFRTGELGSTVCPTVVRIVPGVVLDADGHRKLMEERVAQILRERALQAEKGTDDDDDEAAANAKSDTNEDDIGKEEAIINTIPPDEVPLDDPDHASDPTDPTTKTNLVRAFLLRLHLRRRILNRLFRRMNRLARAMDGESAISSGLNGPTPPRYGDFRFLVDEDGEEFAQFEAMFRKRAEARRSLEERRDLQRNDEVGVVVAAKEDEDEDGDEAMAAAEAEEAPASSATSPSDVAKLIIPQEDADDLNVLMETEVGRDKMVTYQDLTKSLRALGRSQSQSPDKQGKTTPSKKTSKMDVEGAAETTEAVAADIAAEGPPSAIEVQAEQPPAENGAVANGTTSDAAAAAVKTDDDVDDKKQEDEAEDEEVSPLPELVPGKIRKIITLPLAASDPPPEERDFSSSKFTAAGGGGIGALSRAMNSREREIEYNRWKTDVLAKVPEQPTFAELGLENRIFGLEARRKKASGAAASVCSDDSDGKMEVDDKAAASAAAEDDAMDVDDDGKDEGKSKKRSADDAEETEGQEDKDDKSKEEAEKEKIKRPDIFKKKKLISLAAAPSFHSQDQHRIRSIHKDLLLRSRMEKAQKLLDDANASYNKSYALSTNVHNQKNQRTNDLNAQSTLIRNLESQVASTHNAEVDGPRAVWQNAYKQWMGRRMEAGLAVPPMPVEQNAPPDLPASPAAATDTTPNGSAATGSAVSGTPLTSAKSSDLAASEEERETASALGAVVDKVAGGEEEKKGPIYNDPSVLAKVPTDAENFPPFIVPPMNASVAASLDKEREKETALRKRLTEDAIKLNAAEEERKRAWRQMLKLKTDLTALTSGGGGGSRSQRRRPTTSRRAPAPAPAASTYRAQAPVAQAPAASAYAGQSAVVAQNYARSLAAYQQAQQVSVASTARAPAAAANYYAYSGYAQQQQQQYIPTQQTSRPGMPTAPTGTMAMAAANAASVIASSAAQQQQQVAAQAVQMAGVAAAAPAAASTTASSTTSATHQARYSQTAIKNRTYDDGSVAPAVPPKRGDNGLFQRPSGRSRKGMDWDGVHGVWRPAPPGGGGSFGGGGVSDNGSAAVAQEPVEEEQE